jgi:hypothetical protein
MLRRRWQATQVLRLEDVGWTGDNWIEITDMTIERSTQDVLYENLAMNMPKPCTGTSVFTRWSLVNLFRALSMAFSSKHLVQVC